MKESNKDLDAMDRRLPRVVRHLREWRARHARIVYGQVLRGVSYGVGSGAVSLLVIWYETRR
ncbi:hypothetical protein [Streptomyces osmaniensis]|uniref:Uncharacterized protein n=1 Tax=Streptomyces osmaniensis TaxID=593134 RepID=A0ABP6YWF9_9ACTN|nr:hypothetical protein KJK32_46920 [Streptomyces sp. JCM17656]